MPSLRETRPRILIVEDEVLIRVFMRGVFEAVGFKVREAANADEAFELLKAEEFAALVSDIEKPGKMTGLDLAWAVDTKGPRIGLVIISGRHLPSPAAIPAKAKFIVAEPGGSAQGCRGKTPAAITRPFPHPHAHLSCGRN
jgi:DNA-binding NtrC family response regulator